MEKKEHFYGINGITMHTVEAGAEHNKTILFLHGFPEFWYAWRNQLPYFAAHGWHVVAPDQRGYNLSSKPTPVKAYAMGQLTKDIVDLIPKISQGKVVLVGHDWGGAVAWNLALHYPELLEKLVILNMPHPQVLQEHLTHNPKQLLRSWYMGFFQMPWLPEKWLSAFQSRALKKSMRQSSLPGTFTPEEIKVYQTAWQQPNAIKTMLNWYRAYSSNSVKATKQVEVPTLLLWGKEDKFLGSELAAPSIAHCTSGKHLFLDQATHWLHHEQPTKVNQTILEFLTEI